MNMKMRLAAFFCLTLTACFDTGGGTGGGTSVAESEPNDSTTSADSLGGSGSHTFTGTCPDDTDDDYFVASSGAGTFTVSLQWDESGDEDLDLSVASDDGTVDATDDQVPPGDSPATVTVTIPSAQDVFVGVVCFNTASRTYTGTVTVP